MLKYIVDIFKCLKIRYSKVEDIVADILTRGYSIDDIECVKESDLDKTLIILDNIDINQDIRAMRARKLKNKVIQIKKALWKQDLF